jgi:hypothetical protein
MNGKDRMDDGGDTETPFFYAKDRAEYERKSDMEFQISLTASRMSFKTDRQLARTRGRLCPGLGGRRHGHSALKETNGCSAGLHDAQGMSRTQGEDIISVDTAAGRERKTINTEIYILPQPRRVNY